MKRHKHPDDDAKLVGEKEHEKYLIFRCDEQLMGVHISEVNQIIQIPQLTPLPDSPDYIKGIACMHGEAIPVMDMRLRLGKPEKPHDKETCVIIFLLEDYVFGVIVDGVESIENIAGDEILQSSCSKTGGPDYLQGIVGRSPAILLVGADFFISLGDAEMLAQITDSIDWNGNIGGNA